MCLILLFKKSMGWRKNKKCRERAVLKFASFLPYYNTTIRFLSSIRYSFLFMTSFFAAVHVFPFFYRILLIAVSHASLVFIFLFVALWLWLAIPSPYHTYHVSHSPCLLDVQTIWIIVPLFRLRRFAQKTFAGKTIVKYLHCRYNTNM